MGSEGFNYEKYHGHTQHIHNIVICRDNKLHYVPEDINRLYHLNYFMLNFLYRNMLN